MLHTFSSQAPVWLDALRARRCSIKPATLSVWGSIVRTHIVPDLGGSALAQFDNGGMKTFVDGLCSKKLSPRMIRDTVLVAKKIVASAVDANGNFLYPRVWNHAFLDLPRITPTVRSGATREAIEQAIRGSGPYGMLIALMGATGLRIGEALAVQLGGNGTAWDPEARVIRVRQSLWAGRLQEPKTPAAVREVDLCKPMNDALQSLMGSRRDGFLFTTRSGKPLDTSQVYKRALAGSGIEGAHALRRFRVSHLRAHHTVCPEDVLRYWIGHGARSVTDGYSRVAQNVELRREIAEKVGCGFSL